MLRSGTAAGDAIVVLTEAFGSHWQQCAGSRVTSNGYEETPAALRGIPVNGCHGNWRVAQTADEIFMSSAHGYRRDGYRLARQWVCYSHEFNYLVSSSTWLYHYDRL